MVWSFCIDTKGKKVKRPWQSYDYVPAYFGKRKGQRSNCQKFVMEGIEEGRRPYLFACEILWPMFDTAPKRMQGPACFFT